jgi:hypothetical protein
MVIKNGKRTKTEARRRQVSQPELELFIVKYFLILVGEFPGFMGTG